MSEELPMFADQTSLAWSKWWAAHPLSQHRVPGAMKDAFLEIARDAFYAGWMARAAVRDKASR